jgi:CspA family cold shock protein
MSPTAKIIVSLVIAAIAAVATSYLNTGNLPGAVLLIGFGAATILTTLLTSITPGSSSGKGAAPAARPRTTKKTPPKTSSVAAAAEGDREEGQVKWFNVSKGFGFITKDDGDEIFVHFRSIRGSGRRGLRDGQRVSFIAVESDKGPQAEDVEGLD